MKNRSASPGEAALVFRRDVRKAGRISQTGETGAELRMPHYLCLVCTENLIRVDGVMESPKLAE
jgi:hypothetical protein